MHIIPTIDYQKMADAKDFYVQEGFSHLDVPWIVSYESYLATKPDNTRDFSTLGGYLNASAEQSFIELMQGGVPLTKHCAITPCFRDEPVIDDIHYKYFLKLELIDMSVNKDNLDNMMAASIRFFEQYMPVVSIRTGDHTYDIYDRKYGIELGSYGLRRLKDHQWIYGTGLALPRFDVVLSKYARLI